MNPIGLIQYEKGDTVVITCPLSPYDGMVGEIDVANPEKMRYVVHFEKEQITDAFWYNQIKPYRNEEDLQSLIDLSFSLGAAAEWMFDDWLFELRTRYPKGR